MALYHKRDVLTFFSLISDGLGKGGFKSEVKVSFFIANFAVIDIPFYYLKLLHPLHIIDKMSIFKTFTFTYLIYLQVQDVGFMSSTNNFIS